MTIIEAIRATIAELESVRLPAREREAMQHVSNALRLQDAILTWAERLPKEPTPEATPATEEE